MKQNTIISKNIADSLKKILNSISCKNPFVLCDKNTAKFVETLELENKTIILIESGEQNKNLETTSKIWTKLDDLNATRNSVLINFGGGVITDIGGFCASVYKRGIKFINIPTTLLGAVDASIGGKNGIDFLNNKNEIGTFNLPYATIVSDIFYKTLPKEELLSGYGEMIKHSILMSEKDFYKILNYDILKYDHRLNNLIKDSIKFKEKIVDIDFKESEQRKILNFGHTIGHAIESYQLEIGKPIPHGYCVVYGMIIELIISNLLYDFPVKPINDLVNYAKKHYGEYVIEKPNEIILKLHKDKKNQNDKINFTLINDKWEVVVNNNLDSNIQEFIDIYNEKMKK